MFKSISHPPEYVLQYEKMMVNFKLVSKMREMLISQWHKLLGRKTHFRVHPPGVEPSSPSRSLKIINEINNFI